MGYYRLRRYRDSYTRRRIMDSAVRHLKYNDGIKDIADKIKGKINEAIAKFKGLPSGRKVVAILTAIAAAVGTIFTVKNVPDLVRALSGLKKLNADLKEQGELLDQNATPYMNRELSPSYKGMEAASKIAPAIAGIQAIRVIIPLVSTVIAMVSAKIAIAKKQVQEGDDEERVVSEVMTR
jgi:hypothetical protein